MEINDIFKLIDAGFTKDEIMKVISANSIIDTKSGETGKETPKEETPKEETPKEETPKEEPKTEPVTPVVEQRLDDVIKGLQKVTETMQKTALQNSRQPEPENVEDILANIINPTYQKE